MPLMEKWRSVSRGPLMWTLSVRSHEGFEGFRHGVGHAGVVHGADVEEVIFEGLGTHFGHLGHGGGGPAEDDPLGFVDADVFVDAGPDGFFVEFLFVARDVGDFGDVGVAAEADVSLDGFHLEFFDGGDGVPLVFRAGEHEGAVDLVGFEEDEGLAAGLGAVADEFFGEIVGDVDGFNDNFFAIFEFAGIVDEGFGEFGVAGVEHFWTP